jgi:hypothetical protein
MGKSEKFSGSHASRAGIVVCGPGSAERFGVHVDEKTRSKNTDSEMRARRKVVEKVGEDMYTVGVQDLETDLWASQILAR